MKHNINNIFKVLLLCCCVIVITACKKEETEYKVIITVKDLHSQNEIQGADVKIFKGDILIEKKSDMSGKVSHIFDNEAILDVSATHKNKYGYTSIRLMLDKTVEKTVYIN